MKFTEWLQTVNAVATLIALSIAGVWAYVKIRRRREHDPRIEFTFDANFVGVQNEKWLVELSASLNNKGFVDHVIKDVYFEVRCLYESDAIDEGDEDNNFQVKIPRIVKSGSLLPRNLPMARIAPGLNESYIYLMAIPIKATFIFLYGRYKYAGKYMGKIQFDVAEKLIRVPKSLDNLDLKPKKSLNRTRN